jgi:hypothetical protein
MGTRSRVAVMHGDVCKSVYCHYDGYLDYAGRILLAHYDSTKANQLVARGDNSGVKETLEEMNFYEDREAKGEEVNEFLASTPWTIAHSFEEFLEQVEGCGGEYYYVMRDGEWYAGAVYATEGLIKNGLVSLKAAIAAIEAVAEQPLDN